MACRSTREDRPPGYSRRPEGFGGEGTWKHRSIPIQEMGSRGFKIHQYIYIYIHIKVTIPLNRNDFRGCFVSSAHFCRALEVLPLPPPLRRILLLFWRRLKEGRLLSVVEPDCLQSRRHPSRLTATIGPKAGAPRHPSAAPSGLSVMGETIKHISNLHWILFNFLRLKFYTGLVCAFLRCFASPLVFVDPPSSQCGRRPCRGGGAQRRRGARCAPGLRLSAPPGSGSWRLADPVVHSTAQRRFGRAWRLGLRQENRPSIRHSQLEVYGLLQTIKLR